MLDELVKFTSELSRVANNGTIPLCRTVHYFVNNLGQSVQFTERDRVMGFFGLCLVSVERF